MSQKSSIRLFVLVFALMAVLAVVGWLIYNSLTFRITGTDPSANSVATVSPFFKINFNKVITSKNLVVSAEPNIINYYTVSGRTLDIMIATPLSSKQSYDINLKQAFSSAGKEITNKTFSFKPSYVTESNLPKDQQQAILLSQQQFNQIIQSNGLVKLLPFVGGGLSFRVDYKIAYEAGKPSITLTITAPSDTGQQAALAWISSLGFNPSKYNIQYISSKVSS